MRKQREDPQLRVCIGCAGRWYSAAYCSGVAAYCENCGSPLVQTFATTVAAIRNQIATEGTRLASRAR